MAVPLLSDRQRKKRNGLLRLARGHRRMAEAPTTGDPPLFRILAHWCQVEADRITHPPPKQTPPAILL